MASQHRSNVLSERSASMDHPHVTSVSPSPNGAFALALALCAATLSSACGGRPTAPSITIATTTSLEQSGLLAHLLPAFRAESGVEVRVHATGSGQALQMLARRDTVLAISHAPEAEAQALAGRDDWVYEKLAFNEFVVVGPPGDPAGLRGATSAADAFTRIARSAARFVSRGDRSGTHDREEGFWAAIGERPGGDRLIVSGRGMAQALRHADEAQGYTLTDEATFERFRDQLELAILFRGDPLLLNTYALLYPRNEPAAAAFAEWLTRGAGRALIESYTVAGRRQFFVWPPGCAGRQPSDQPCASAAPPIP